MPTSGQSEIIVNEGRLYHLGIRADQIASNLIQVGDPARAYRVAARFDSISHEVRNREYVTLTGTWKGIPISALGTGIGTDNVEIALIEAYAALSLDLKTARRKKVVPGINLIRVGTSGGVQPDIEAGVLGISEYALGLDTTGLYYDHPAADSRVRAIEIESERLLSLATKPDSRFKGRILPYASRACPQVFRGLCAQARHLGAEFTHGITVSTPGFYGPSDRFIEGLTNTVPDIKAVFSKLRFEGRRAINMEMESSLLFHLADALGWRAGTICPIISRPATHDSIADYRPMVEASIDIALSTVRELVRQA